MTSKKPIYTEEQQKLMDILVEGVDYGKIEGKTKAGKSFETKPALLKAGAEKIAAHYDVLVDLEPDLVTWSMAKIEGEFCYVARAMKRGHDAHAYIRESFLETGRGSCNISEKSSANVAIKIAQKRAYVDVMLRLAKLSGVFTQDIEEMEAERSTPASVKQKMYITKLVKEKGLNRAEFIEKVKASGGSIEKDDTKEELILSSRNASGLIEDLMKTSKKEEEQIEQPF